MTLPPSRQPARPARVALIALALALAVGLVVPAFASAPAAGAPPPEPVCGVCGDAFESAAQESNVSVDASRSVVDVHLRADGSARWTVQTTVDADAAASFRAHPADLDAVARRAAADGPVDDPRTVTARVVDERIVVGFTDPAAGRVAHGAFLASPFDRGPSWWTVNAERFVVHAPDGYATFHAPADADTGPHTVTWRGTTAESPTPRHGTIEPGTVLAFAPVDGVGAVLRGTIAVAAVIVPPVLSNALTVGALPGIVLALVAAGLLVRQLGGGRDDDRQDPRAADTDRRTARVSLVVLAVAAAIVGIVAALLARGTVPDAVGYAATLALPAAGFFVLGRRGVADRLAWLLVVALAVLPVLSVAAPGLLSAVAASVPPTMGSVGTAVVLILAGVWTVGALLVCVPAFFVGRSIGPVDLRSV